MAELLTLARPYAKAAFAYASEQGATDNWSNALQVLSAAVQDEAFSAYLNRPELTPVQQVELFAKVLGEQQSQAVSNFLILLADNDRLALRFNAAVNVSVEVNPALIAGVVIRAGDQVIDDSALNKLEKMRTRLLA